MNGIGWESLELMVERAVARLAELRKENGELREQPPLHLVVDSRHDVDIR